MIYTFRKQLEKAYGLCKRCDNVLEKLLQTQKLNIFGNRIRQLQRETASLFDLNKPYKGTKKIPIFIKFVYYFMILFAVLLLINAIATFDYSDGHLKKILPHFLFYIIRKTKLILNTLVKGTEDLQMEMYPLFQSMSEHCSNLSEEMEKITTDLWNTVSEQHVIKHCLQTAAEKINKFSLIQRNENHLINCALTATSGLLLQLILSFWSKNRGLTKVSQIMSWAVLILMSLNRLNGKYELLQLLLKVCTLRYFNSNFSDECLFQIFCPLFIICTTSAEASLERVDTQNKKKLKKRKNIRKLIKEDDVFSDLSDCEKFTETNSSSSNKEKTVQLKCDTSNATARADCTTPHNNLETELNTSLSNLDLGSKHRGFNSNSSKPLLSPSKLNNVTKNPWTAGGFWSNPYSYSPLEPAPCNLSRSSSHSSGFGSHTNENVNFNSLPASPGNSVSGGDDHHSVFSEPPYHLGNGQFELYKSGNATIATSFYSPNSRNFGVHNPFQREVVWSSYGRGANSFAYASSAINLNLPHRNGYVVGSVFKNLSDPVKIQF